MAPLFPAVIATGYFGEKQNTLPKSRRQECFAERMGQKNKQNSLTPAAISLYPDHSDHNDTHV